MKTFIETLLHFILLGLIAYGLSAMTGCSPGTPTRVNYYSSTVVDPTVEYGGLWTLLYGEDLVERPVEYGLLWDILTRHGCTPSEVRALVEQATLRGVAFVECTGRGPVKAGFQFTEPYAVLLALLCMAGCVLRLVQEGKRQDAKYRALQFLEDLDSEPLTLGSEEEARAAQHAVTTTHRLYPTLLEELGVEVI